MPDNKQTEIQERQNGQKGQNIDRKPLALRPDDRCVRLGAPGSAAMRPAIGPIGVALFCAVLAGAPQGAAADNSGDMQAIGTFSIDRTEVTIGQFARFTGATGLITEAERAGGGLVVTEMIASAAILRQVRSEMRKLRTDTVSEALLLEANLVKRYQPRFNVRLKDDKSYPFIKVTLADDFPRIERTRKLPNDGSRYFGPYASASSVDESMNLIRRIFPFRTCTIEIREGERALCGLAVE